MSYSEIRKDKEFEEYKATAKKLTYVDLSSLPYEEWICFLLNIYNSLVIHALVENGVPTTSYSRMRFYRVTRFFFFTPLSLFSPLPPLFPLSLLPSSFLTYLTATELEQKISLLMILSMVSSVTTKNTPSLSFSNPNSGR